MTEWPPEPPSKNLDRLFIGGSWVRPSTDSRIGVTIPSTERHWFDVAAAGPADIARPVHAARDAFDHAPWPRMSPRERADCLERLSRQIGERKDTLATLWTAQVGQLHRVGLAAFGSGANEYARTARLAETFPFEEHRTPGRGGELALLVQEPVGVVAVIIPWNAPTLAIAAKCAPALLAGCTIVLKSAPEAPGDGYVFAEMAEEAGIPPGVVNVVTAGREVSELLVTNPGVDKVTFTGSTAAGERIGALCASRVARCTLELGGKSPALVLDDFDLSTAARSIAASASGMAGQVCSSLTRLIVSQDRHDDFVEALAAEFAAIKTGDPFDPEVDMGPLAMARQLERVEGYIAKGREEGAVLATGGKRPAHLDRGYENSNGPRSTMVWPKIE